MANQWKFFTPDEVKTLNENLWVKKATTKLIRYTDEFKEEFLRQHKEGKTSRAIVEGLGFDPNMLGWARIEGLRTIARNYAAKKQMFFEENSDASDVSDPSTNAQLKRMQHRLSYMEQQIEFIKKTILAERKARRS